MYENMKQSLFPAIGPIAMLVLLCAGTAAAQSDYTPITVQHGGAISGTVTWTGPIPKIPKLPISKNPEICDPQGLKARDLERLLINPDGNGVANTVVFLRGITTGITSLVVYRCPRFHPRLPPGASAGTAPTRAPSQVRPAPCPRPRCCTAPAWPRWRAR